ncbi:MBL fold metallo-hydrolase [Vandammella animalimorsus]|uniref:MBL fold metallo-hydrolase n=1 Tax=Vandammella animalimorsus TaxID=2029117 RepID=A0A2A2T1X1_9BURK|nr:MBL fold metallo-hydrolase [Vandammella animalimorsus]PAT31156.1 MBL fold metallo-hydrolase [Vandammella animalimorsus]PAX15536.1 MBL fold metallo-hydrolase [Vandammella animalimorsus]PAX17289.1 MBL fold metallo-hydrolase [Vandammella animalimorsus]
MSLSLPSLPLPAARWLCALALALPGAVLAPQAAAAPDATIHADDDAPPPLAQAATPAAPEGCRNTGLDVVVLGSGGPELGDRRASSSYLLRENGQARFLIDLGPGAALNFERAQGRIEDVQALLFTHLHVDHVGDLPALIKAAFFSRRNQDLPLYGPTGSELFPTTPLFVQRQFGPQGVYPYLADYLSGDESFTLKPVAVAADRAQPVPFRTELAGFALTAMPVEHGLVPALAWRIEKDGCALVVSGDTSNRGRTLDALAQGADVFIAHNAIPEDSEDRIARLLHMPPSEIGRIAAQAGSRSLVLSHFMRRTEGVQQATAQAIARHYGGPLAFAQDCDIYALHSGARIGQCPARADGR